MYACVFVYVNVYVYADCALRNVIEMREVQRGGCGRDVMDVMDAMVMAIV